MGFERCVLVNVDAETLKIRTNGEPEFRLMCHCKSCQKRTGSDYSHNVYISHEQVEIFGEVKPIHGQRKKTGT